MSNKLRERKNYSMEFKLRMLKEYYESGSTKYRLCKKYSVDYVTFSRWEGYFHTKNRHKAQRKAKFYINKCRSASCMQGGLKQASA